VLLNDIAIKLGEVAQRRKEPHDERRRTVNRDAM